MKKLLGYIFLGIVVIVLAVYIYFYGLRLEVFIGVAILTTFLYFYKLVRVELKIKSATFVNSYAKIAGKNANQDDFIKYKKQYGTRWAKLYAVLAILIVYLVGLLCMVQIQQPNSSTPYFNNISHTALSNNGVAFANNLTLYNAAANTDGLYPCKEGLCSAMANNNGYTITTNNFYKPFMVALNKNEFYPKNNFFTAPINNTISITNGSTTIKFLKVSQTLSGIKKILGSNNYFYDIKFSFSTSDTSYLKPLNIGGIFTDTFNYKGIINKGISLKKIFYNKRAANSNTNGKVITAELANAFDDCYLLANNEADNSYLTFFPSASFFKEGFNLLNNNVKQIPISNTNFNISNNIIFFIGLENSRLQNYFEKIDKSIYNTVNVNALKFEYATYKYFTSSINKEKLGTLHQNFIVNNYTQLINTKEAEGFLMHDAINANAGNLINGTINFECGAPNTILKVGVIDDNNNLTLTDLKEQKFFNLKSASKTNEWLFEVKDFSVNAYSLPKQFWYFTLLCLAFIATILFNYNKNLRRVEPVIYIVWLTLFIIRHILLWRISTFPPVNAISKSEFNSLLYFDTNLFSAVPIPSALIFSLLALLFINVYRLVNKRQWGVNLVKFNIIPIKWRNGKLYFYITGKNRYVIFHIAALLVAMAIFYLVPYEILKRVFSIFIPLCAYFYYSKKIHSMANYKYQYFKINHSNSFLRFLHKFVMYFIESPHFYLTLATLLALLFMDRGFAIIFLLFLVIKTSIFSFIRNVILPQGLSFNKLVTNPKYFYIYGVLFFIVYVILIGVKSSFYYLLSYKLFIVMAIAFLIAIYYLFVIRIKAIKNKIIVGLCACCIVFLIVPVTYNWANAKVNNVLRHVSYRASVLFQPIENLIASENYDSFEEDKIIETAQNQWFINSYVNKKINYNKPINLRTHFNRGVDYITQTRDLVMPRYLIAELGPITVILILLLLLLPLLYYLFSYALAAINVDNKVRFIAVNYTSASVLLLFFSIALIVALTATNRFVFVGQDFPFLSLTSKMALLIPLMAFVAVLLSNYKPRAINTINFALSLKRSVFFIVIIGIVLVVSGSANILNTDIFSVNQNTTKAIINNDLNNVLTVIQNESDVNFEATNTSTDPTDSEQYINHLKSISKQLATNPLFIDILKNSDNYTRSILNILITNPTLALKNSSPLYMRYNNGKFEAEYNQNIYLELPAYEANEQWGGNIYEDKLAADSSKWQLMINNKTTVINTLPLNVVFNAAQLVVVPQSWLPKNDTCNILIAARNIGTTVKDNTIIQVAKKNVTNYSILNASNFAAAMHITDNAIIKTKGEITQVSFIKNTGNIFMKNLWVNGRRRMVYPAGSNLFWMYHYANTASLAFKRANRLQQNTSVTIDYNLQSNMQQYLNSALNIDKYAKIKNFKFSVIAADGLGNIRVMADFANNRTILNPNNDWAIKELEQQNYFFSNRTNERDQWGNSNLITMLYGPGSSIKPIMLAAAATSGLHDWTNLKLSQSNKFDIKYKEKKPAVYHYAGFNLKKKGWLDVDGDNVDCDLKTYIAKSNNFYHSLVMFLGSYPKDSFKDSVGNYSLKNILIPQLYDSANYFPLLNYAGGKFLLPNYKGGNWPKTSEDSKQHFGSDKSILAKGLATQYNLLVNDQNKNDFTIKSNTKVSFAERLIYDTMQRKQIGSYLWSFPEESYFIQKQRSFADPAANFNLGLKTPTSGGTPIEITPIKMVELYGRLFTQTNYNPKVTRIETVGKFSIDADSIGYINFLKANVFEGMKQLFTIGTLTAFKAELKIPANVYKNYFLYAKTGTIKEASGKQNSKKLALVISKYDMVTYGPNNKIFVIYINAENIGEANYTIYKNVLDNVIESDSFKTYMQK